MRSGIGGRLGGIGARGGESDGCAERPDGDQCCSPDVHELVPPLE
jgi:hypothetical protein